jgi:peptidoglycan/LPS O-acetylase OafA/YrhL
LSGAIVRRRLAISLGAAGVVSILLWALPLYEDLSRPAGNLHLLRTFFSLPHPSEHSWRVAIEVVCGQLAIFPLALCHALGRASTDVGMTGRHLLAGGQAAAVAAGLVIAWRRRDQPAALLSAISLGLFVVAIFAVHEIRGEIFGHLIAWISVLGFIACTALAAALVPAVVGDRRPVIGVLIVGLPLLALALHAGGDKPMVRDRDVPLETLTAHVETFLRHAGIDHLRLEIPAHDEWPRAA